MDGEFIAIVIIDSLLILGIGLISLIEGVDFKRRFQVWIGEVEPEVTKISTLSVWTSWLKEKFFGWLEKREEKNAHKWRGPRHALMH